MANTGETNFIGTVLEISGDDGTTWSKVVCNEGVVPIDFGTKKETEFTCLETGIPTASLGSLTFEEASFSYFWTQSATNAGDTSIKTAHSATNPEEQKIDVKITMNNKIDTETVGTTFVIPFKVKGYKHIGETDGVWKTETTWKQIGLPVETAAVVP